MAQFVWIEWNEAKLALHHLSRDEVEFARHGRRDTEEWTEPEPRVERYGRVPNGRWIKIIWRHNGFGDDALIFVLTAYHVPGPPGRVKH